METRQYHSVVAAHAAHAPHESYRKLCAKLRKGPVTLSNGCVMTRLATGQIAVEFEPETLPIPIVEATVETTVDEPQPEPQPEELEEPEQADRVEQLWQGWVNKGRLTHWQKHITKTRNSYHRHDPKWWERRFCWESGMQSFTMWKDVWERYRHEMVTPPPREKAEAVRQQQVQAVDTYYSYRDHIRNIWQTTVYDALQTRIEEKEGINKAKVIMGQLWNDRAWFSYARHEGGVSITDAEVERLIKEAKNELRWVHQDFVEQPAPCQQQQAKATKVDVNLSDPLWQVLSRETLKKHPPIDTVQWLVNGQKDSRLRGNDNNLTSYPRKRVSKIKE